MHACMHPMMRPCPAMPPPCMQVMNAGLFTPRIGRLSSLPKPKPRHPAALRPHGSDVLPVVTATSSNIMTVAVLGSGIGAGSMRGPDGSMGVRTAGADEGLGTTGRGGSAELMGTGAGGQAGRAAGHAGASTHSGTSGDMSGAWGAGLGGPGGIWSGSGSGKRAADREAKQPLLTSGVAEAWHGHAGGGRSDDPAA